MLRASNTESDTMNETDPRWTWWTNAMETVALDLQRLKRSSPGENWHAVDQRIAKWLGREVLAGLKSVRRSVT